MTGDGGLRSAFGPLHPLVNTWAFKDTLIVMEANISAVGLLCGLDTIWNLGANQSGLQDWGLILERPAFLYNGARGA